MMLTTELKVIDKLFRYLSFAHHKHYFTLKHSLFTTSTLTCTSKVRAAEFLNHMNNHILSYDQLPVPKMTRVL